MKNPTMNKDEDVDLVAKEIKTIWKNVWWMNINKWIIVKDYRENEVYWCFAQWKRMPA